MKLPRSTVWFEIGSFEEGENQCTHRHQQIQTVQHISEPSNQWLKAALATKLFNGKPPLSTCNLNFPADATDAADEGR